MDWDMNKGLRGWDKGLPIVKGLEGVQMEKGCRW